MKKFKKLVASLLAVLMVLSLAPVTALADGLELRPIHATEQVEEPAIEQDEEPAETEIGIIDLEGAEGSDDESYDTQAASSGVTTVIACSDFQYPNGDEGGKQIVSGILNAMKSDGIETADGFLCAGDYDFNMDTEDSAVLKHVTALKEAVESVYGTGMQEIYVQGNHDQVKPGNKNGLTTSRAHDADEYGVYVINEDDYMWGSNASYSDTSYSGMSAEQIVKQTANSLATYLAGKTAEGYKNPIFVVAHLPLHYSMRTKNDGDGMYANYLFDVLNAAGENGLNIIYMYGHDHSNGWDDYLGGSCVYLEKGKSINIAQSSTTKFEAKTLNFTYMNAGFTGYYENHNGTDNTLTMTAFQIYSDKVIVSRYSQSGQHNLKCKGVTNAYKSESGYAPNTEVVGTPQTVTLSEVREVPAITIDGKAVSEYAVDVAKVKTLAIGTKNFDGYTVKIESSNSEIAKINTDGTETTVSFPGKTGTAKITATGTSSERAAGDTVSATLTLTVSNSASAERTYTHVTSVDQLESGKQYLIIYNAGTDYFMLPEVVTKSGSSGYRTGFDIVATTVAGPDTITGTSYIDYEWTLTKSGNGWLMGKDSTYAKLTNTSNTGVTATLENPGDAFTIGGSADNFTFSAGSYVLNYNESRGLINGYEKEPAAFYIYKLTAEGGSTEPTEPTEETIYLYVGNKAVRTINGEYHTKYDSNDNPTAVEAVVKGTPASTEPEKTVKTAEKADVTVDTLISKDRSNWRATNYYYKVAENDYQPLYAKKSGRWNWDSYTYTYTWGYGTSSSNVIEIGTQETQSTSDAPNIDVYNEPKTTTVPGESVPASTVITFTAKAVGTAVIKVGEHTYTVIVKEKAAQNDYPEYPNEGSVRVDKAAQGIDFQSTGVAKVELSTSGVPMKKGVDVILMLDTSSSMKDTVTGSSKSRIQVLRESVANMLEEFNTPDATTGEIPDIRIAIADFNGYETTDSTDPLYLSGDSIITGGVISDGAGNNAKVYTGTNDYTAGAFVSASEYNTSAKRTVLVNNIVTASGTNYDAAFYYSYQLGSAISAKNAEDGEERDLYVVFMSDGAPFQYNFISGRSTQSGWNKWLQGTENNAANYTYFYNENGNRNWWAEAIKGTAGEMYTVIDKTSTDNYGGNRYTTQVSGLGAKMYSIGFCLAVDQQITVASMENVLQKIATDSSYYFKADSADDLDNAFGQIAANIKKAGYNASFVDKMGEAYNIQLKPFKKADGTSVSPEITVSTYEIWKRSDYESGNITIDKVGTRKNDTPTIQERVTFNDDGTEAYSNQINGGSTNIISNGKIIAKLFTYDLTTEEFSWNVGDITENEQVLSYYVYLDGSMEGTRGAGSYPTNESAILYYKNWLDNDAHKETVSPVMPWKSANVSYAFYLVNAQGEPIVNQSTGEIGSFANAVKVTQPVVYSEVLLNSAADVEAEIVAKNALPSGYALYDESAGYKVSIKSDNSGFWIIDNGTGVATTYVAQYDVKDSSAVTNEVNSANVNNGQNDYTHTVVWFAVKYVISTIPDAVVIDFGLPVDISVLANDILGENAVLAGVGKEVPATTSTSALATGFANEYEGTFGTAAVNGKKVRYTPSNMQMDATEKFAYAAQAATESDNNYYYSTVTVIPAANVYYEDSFITFNNNGAEWTVVGETKDGITQQEDRPGKFSLAAYDANNVYGFDAAYKECSEFSLGSARKVTVSKATNANAPTAVFTFKGTGFDLISLTSNRTGTILVDVVGKDNGVEKHWIVDTYYGYERTIDSTNPYLKYTWTYGEDEQWHVVKEEVSSIPDGAVIGGTPENSGDVTYEHNYKWTVVTAEGNNALYQIPVIRGQGLEYGTYTVTITPKYSSARDHANKGSYDFYLDAVRIYDPAGTNPGGEIGDAYKADGEGWSDIIELRNNIIDAKSLSVDANVNGVVFVDGTSAGTFEDYNNFGPNNEVYLASGQAVAFKLSVADASKIDTIQIAAKTPTGTGVIAQVNSGTPTPINTATEMYYTITHRITWDGNISNTIVIANIGTGVLSFTNIKITYKEAPTSNAETVVDNQLLEEAPAMLMSMLGIEAPTKERAFEPKTFTVKLNYHDVYVREYVKVTVTTSDDVDYITVGDKKITRYTEERTWGGFRKGLVKTGKRIWSYYVSFDTAGQQVISVVAYDADGLASEAVDNTVNVKSRSSRRGRTSEWHV